jgi:Protein of unknown function (DUF3176)
MEENYVQTIHLLPENGRHQTLAGRQNQHLVGDDLSSKPTPFPPHSKASSLQSFWLRGWLGEIAALVGALVALVALISVLRVYENKPNPELPLGISLNTIVSIASTIFRASMMLSVASAISQAGWIWLVQQPRPLSNICWYDSASRGPLGSVLLLWRLRFLSVPDHCTRPLNNVMLTKYSRAASIGALITLLTLALDPFFQQTIKYVPRSSIDPIREAVTVAAHGYNGSIGALYTISSAGEHSS